ncbi:MAG: DEAD/DEAH box helicase [Caldilineaceae bacterium]
MPLHPILALHQVIDDYRNYIRTEFRAKDAALQAALERELDRPRFLAQEPFYQAHRPFRSYKAWNELPLDPRLAAALAQRTGGRPAYIHQSAAVEELLSPQGCPVVVTTGTGSGKSEAFLVPVIQNALEDATRFKQNGLTAILIYPMNALANDQEKRINEYLESAGLQGVIKVAKYDRGTSQSEREALRSKPPHILLTNYMMLEYLLIRPADRDAIFANHRCRFLVLDEVHSYRGTLGSNIALLVRRLRAHLDRAIQDWQPNVSAADQTRRYPNLLPIGTSATIKSINEAGIGADEARRQRDQAVQAFFAPLVGVEPATVQVFGEELEELPVPTQAHYAPRPVQRSLTTPQDLEEVRLAICALANLPASTPLAQAVKQARILWDLNHWLIKRPKSLQDLVNAIRTEVPERQQMPAEVVQQEVELALAAGSALPDGTDGALRLRAHQFIRGGWQFHRCLNPACGKLYPMGEESCRECGYQTAPLHLCRNCGADYLQLAGDPVSGTLHPYRQGEEAQEWLVYTPERFENEAILDEDDESESEGEPAPRRNRAGAGNVPRQMGGTPVHQGSLDPRSLLFSSNQNDYPLHVIMLPRRTKCLCCGGTAGSRNVISPLSIGTSAALKAMSEGLLGALEQANRSNHSHDGKDRLLIFCDSRQDAAHQARFIIFASRYDRMRRRLMQILQAQAVLTLQRAVEELAVVGRDDNPHRPENSQARITGDRRQKMQAWEEAPLLDDIAMTAGYRATLLNLGLIWVEYEGLYQEAATSGVTIAATLGISGEQFAHLCRCILDEMRVRGALSRPLLQYHPSYTGCPEFVESAEWERAVRLPQGYPCDANGNPLLQADSATVPPGIRLHNAWRRAGVGGRHPSVGRVLSHLLQRYGVANPTDGQAMMQVLNFLCDGSFLTPVTLYGFQQGHQLLQVNSEVLQLRLLDDSNRRRCRVCGSPRAGAAIGALCPVCHGVIVEWREEEIVNNRNVQRIRALQLPPLVAQEHTAQVPNNQRSEIEADFKAKPEESPLNLLACSPTLEMGIDVGGLDAVAMRNVPPRPDNYAQRGGRAGRRSRVGLVLGYARSTPHDQYFYDRPQEMIAGEVPAPALTLRNRDVLLRHINAIVFGAAQPGLAGRMVEYVNAMGELNEESINKLIEALRAQFGYARQLAQDAFGPLLAEAAIDANALQRHLDELPSKVRNVFDRTAQQVRELRRPMEAYYTNLHGARENVHAGEMVARLLGVQSDSQTRSDADDRSAGYPLRRFAEFGILPGYEFPTEPATLRLLGDKQEDEPVSVERRVGLAQFQPDAQVYARAKRWKVIGLDNASPWNPRGGQPSWRYQECSQCHLRFDAQEPRCPRCGHTDTNTARPAFAYGGFVARRDEAPVLNEEERIAMRNLVALNPQWNGDVTGRWSSAGWSLMLRQQETVYWLNEGLPLTQNEREMGVIGLTPELRGFNLCPSCGAMLQPMQVTPSAEANRGRRNSRTATRAAENFGHHRNCPQLATTPTAHALSTYSNAETLRLLIPINYEEWSRDVLNNIRSWGLSLGYALHIGLCRQFTLEGSEIEFSLEGPWSVQQEGRRLGLLSPLSIWFGRERTIRVPPGELSRFAGLPRLSSLLRLRNCLLSLSQILYQPTLSRISTVATLPALSGSIERRTTHGQPLQK